MKNICFAILFTALFTGCDDEFLNKKPNKAIIVPQTLDELQALLDNSRVMNVTPALGILGSDDMMMSDAGYNGLTQAIERQSYPWHQNVFEGVTSCADWNVPYEQVFCANVVLDQLKNITIDKDNQAEWNGVKGRALFYRAHAFYQLAQLFAVPYHTNGNEMGIPLRTTADVNAPVFRSSLQQTYQQIVDDLTTAETLIPSVSSMKTQPNKAANYALLARTFLTMEEYDKAKYYATLALEQNGFLLDYNTLNSSSARPIPAMNDEILFYAITVSYRFGSVITTYVDTALYAEYETDDLRRELFFRSRASNRYTFKGNYTGNIALFGGLATDEVFLTRAEAHVRTGDIVGALEDLNALLQKRSRADSFVPVTESDPDSLLPIILMERRKELVFRGNNWTDLRRLNHYEHLKRDLSRKVNGVVYHLPANDTRYVYPIPFQEISVSGIPQNPR